MTKNKLILPTKAVRHRRFGSVDPIAGTKPTSKAQMADLQNQREDYLFDIDRVGICRVRHPIQIHSALEPQIQTSIATIALKTNLPRHSKGINMSRLTEHLEHYRHKGLSADLPALCDFVRVLAERMDQHKAEITLSFPWFYERTSPVSALSGLNHADATITVGFEQGKPFTATVGLRVAVTTLCPCSKEISEYSAHNQRGIVTISVELDPSKPHAQDWKAALLEATESNASSPLHPVLKRTDEKHVTERAYENPGL